MKHAIDRDRGPALLLQPRLRPQGHRARAVGGRRRRQRAAQGASTITQQFVKTALEAQSNRTVFQKLREAALAYHLTRKWSKEKILTEYLNAIYFGNGAYGIESAARVYFGKRHGYGQAGGCGATAREHVRLAADAARGGAARRHRRLAERLRPDRAPGRRAPPPRPRCCATCATRATSRRASTRSTTQDPLPTQADLTPPQEKSESPYFTSWVRQQVVDHFGPFRAFSGGLQITTSLDLDLQQAAENAISQMLPPGSGADRLARGDRQPAPARCARWSAAPTTRTQPVQPRDARASASPARRSSRSCSPRRSSRASPPARSGARSPKQFVVPHSGGKEFFLVKNYGDAYYGSNTLASATTVSDNSVYAEVGIKVGTRKIARVARRMGIRTPISTNYAMILGGLRDGVTPLDMAHAYETFATGGQRICERRSSARRTRARSGSTSCATARGKVVIDNRQARCSTKQVIPPGVAVDGRRRSSRRSSPTAPARRRRSPASRPARPARRRTTATPGSSAATSDLTVAVWVGYPDKLVPMLTRVRRPAGRRRHLPGDDLAQLHGRRRSAILDQRKADAAARAGGQSTTDARPATAAARSSTGPATVAARRRRRRRPGRRRRPAATGSTRRPAAAAAEAPAAGGAGGGGNPRAARAAGDGWRRRRTPAPRRPAAPAAAAARAPAGGAAAPSG